MAPNEILLNSQICAMFKYQQRSFLLQKMWTNAETHSQIILREWDTLKHTALKGTSPSNRSHQDSGNPAEEEAERLENPGDGKHQANKKSTWSKIIWIHGGSGSMYSCWHGSAPGPWIGFCGFHLVFLWDSWMWTCGSLFLLPSLGLFYFCLLVLFNPYVLFLF